MKNQITITCLSLLLAFGLSAQDKLSAIEFNVGITSIDGDVNIKQEGISLNIGYKYPITKTWSAIATYGFHTARGLDRSSTFKYADIVGQWTPAFRTRMHALDLMVHGEYRIPTTRISVGASLGAGLYAPSTKVNILNSEGISYSESTGGIRYFVGEVLVFPDLPGSEFVVISYDDTYETDAIVDDGAFSIGEQEIFWSLPLRLTLMVEVNQKIDIGLIAQTRISNNDTLDGINAYDFTPLPFGHIRESTNADIIHNLQLSMTYRLGEVMEY